MQIESNVTWNNSYFLSCTLEEVISEEWPDSSSRWSIIVENVRTHHVLHAVDGIELHYAVGWPINMLLNEETLSKYNSIFRFELKLKWALWTLNNLRFAGKYYIVLCYLGLNANYISLFKMLFFIYILLL